MYNTLNSTEFVRHVIYVEHILQYRKGQAGNSCRTHSTLQNTTSHHLLGHRKQGANAKTLLLRVRTHSTPYKNTFYFIEHHNAASSASGGKARMQEHILLGQEKNLYDRISLRTIF